MALTTTGPSLPNARDAVLRGSFGSEEPRTAAESAPCALQLRNSGNGFGRRDATTRWRPPSAHDLRADAILGAVTDRNVLGGELETCGTDPVTGFYRDGCCTTGPEDRGSHTICAVVTAEFLEHQRRIGNDLSTPMPPYRFPGLKPGDRWCVTAANWLRAHQDGAGAYVVLASTHERALDIVPLAALEQHAVDVPRDPGSLG
jgi:uncharacterized protein